MDRTMLGASFLIASLIAVCLAAAQESYSYRYAHLRHVEGAVTVQRAAEPEPQAGGLNEPLLPGDRLWTQARARAEVVFADGTVLRLGESTKLDFVELDKELVVRLWSGSVIVKVDEPRVDVRVDTSAGSIYSAARGTYRVDVGEDRVSLAVLRGSAELASAEGSVLVAAGERSDIEPGMPPSTVRAVDTARMDELGAWSESRDRMASRTADVVVRSLPHEIHHYAEDLDDHGAWERHSDHGYVWYPQVNLSWAPYRHGRWHYTHFGYTWVSHEPWGWAPYHYGRWGHGHRGWYWIPGAYWSPAWVSFAFGPAWIGWSPLGFHNRPVFVLDSVFHHGRRYRGGKAVPRGVYEGGAGWNFVGRQQFGGSAGTARLRADAVRPSAHRARVFESGAVLRRDLTPMPSGATRRGSVEARAVSRHAAPRRLTRPAESSSLSRATAERRPGIDAPRASPARVGGSTSSSRAITRGSTFRSPSRATSRTAPRRESSGLSGSAGNGSSMSGRSRPSTGIATSRTARQPRPSSVRSGRGSSSSPTAASPRRSSTRAPRAIARPSPGRGGSVGVQRGTSRGSRNDSAGAQRGTSRGSRGATRSRGNRPR